MTPHAALLFETAIGPCGLAWSPAGLTAVHLLPADDAGTAAPLRQDQQPGPPDLPGFVTAAVTALRRYFAAAAGPAGGPDSDADFAALPLDFAAVGRRDRQIYAILRTVPRGQTTTYGALAAAAGLPGGARAVGGAMARNPWPVIVPCHRVLAAGGRPGGFSAPGGLRTKQQLLALEGVELDKPGQDLIPGLIDSDAL